MAKKSPPASGYSPARSSSGSSVSGSRLAAVRWRRATTEKKWLPVLPRSAFLSSLRLRSAEVEVDCDRRITKDEERQVVITSFDGNLRAAGNRSKRKRT